MKKKILPIIMLTMIIIFSACAIKDNNSSNDTDTKTEEDDKKSEDIDDEKTDDNNADINNKEQNDTDNVTEKKVPKSIDELHVDMANNIRLKGVSGDEIVINDKEKLDLIKNIIGRARICKDKSDEESEELLAGGIDFELYNDDEYLCYIFLADVTETGIFYVSNDEYSFDCEIAKGDAIKLVDVFDEN